jgi:raffinose/stachyose/melibiose transport system substrate-binding protein
MATTTFRGLNRIGLVGAAALLAATTACSGSSGGGAAPTASSGAKASGALNILVSSATGSDAGFKAVTDAFSKDNPDVKVTLTPVPNENYNQARSSRLTAGSVDVVVAFPRQLPDYVPAGNEGDDARLADQGGFLDLSGQPFLKNFNQSVLDGTKYKGKNYTVPTGLSYYTGMFYNKKILSDAGVQVPTTWEEFTKACDALKAKGIVPFGIAGKDSAGVTMLGVINGLYPTVEDKNALAKGLYDGSVKLDQGPQLTALQKQEKIYSYAEPNFAGVNYSTMTADFVAGKFAMMGDGTWNTTTIQRAGAGKLDFGYAPLPSGDSADANKFLGGKVELSLAVPANAKNPKAAVAWLDFFSTHYDLFNAQAGFAPAVASSKGDAFYTEIQKYTSTFQPAWDTVWIANAKAGQNAQVPFNWAGIKPMGSGDAAAAAAAAQKDWQAGLGK